MSAFGSDNPREMPPHFFYGSVRLKYDTAVRAEPDKQNCSICPRYWYLDAVFRCDRCGSEFEFTAAEQRLWYEEYGFWVDSRPKHCLACARSRPFDRNTTEPSHWCSNKEIWRVRAGLPSSSINCTNAAVSCRLASTTSAVASPARSRVLRPRARP